MDNFIFHIHGMSKEGKIFLTKLTKTIKGLWTIQWLVDWPTRGRGQGSQLHPNRREGSSARHGPLTSFQTANDRTPSKISSDLRTPLDYSTLLPWGGATWTFSLGRLTLRPHTLLGLIRIFWSQNKLGRFPPVTSGSIKKDPSRGKSTGTPSVVGTSLGKQWPSSTSQDLSSPKCPPTPAPTRPSL